MANLTNTSRYSITFRSVGKNFKNSTIIIGDSNTKHLKFSTGKHREKGTFGYNMPGERVETFHISQIDERERKCLGYQNIPCQDSRKSAMRLDFEHLKVQLSSVTCGGETYWWVTMGYDIVLACKI